MHKTNFSKANSVNLKKVLITSLLPIFLYLIFSLVFSLFCYISKDPTKSIGLYSLLSLLLSGGISGLVNSKIGKNKGMLLAICSTSVSSLILFVVSIIFSGGVGSGLLMNLLCYIMVSVFSAFLGGCNMGKSKRKIRARR